MGSFFNFYWSSYLKTQCSLRQSLKGIRKCHPPICHFGITIILRWRQFRIDRCVNSSLSIHSLPKEGHRFSFSKVFPSSFAALLHARKRRTTPVIRDRGINTERNLHKQTLWITLLFRQFSHVFPSCSCTVHHPWKASPTLFCWKGYKPLIHPLGVSFAFCELPWT